MKASGKGFMADRDGDSKPDLLCYVEWSAYPFFSRVALTMKERPGYVLGETIVD